MITEACNSTTNTTATEDHSYPGTGSSSSNAADVQEDIWFCDSLRWKCSNALETRGKPRPHFKVCGPPERACDRRREEQQDYYYDNGITET